MATDYDNESQNMIMECDTCGCEDSERGSFRECIEKFKQIGWKTFKGDDGWENSCPKCFEDWKKEQAKKRKVDAPIQYPQ